MAFRRVLCLSGRLRAPPVRTFRRFWSLSSSTPGGSSFILAAASSMARGSPSSLAQIAFQQLLRWLGATLTQAQYRCDGRGYQRRIRDGGERHEEYPVLEIVYELGGGLQPHTSLARPSRPHERQ